MQRPPTIKMGPFQALHLKSCLQVSISMARLCQGVRKIFVSVIVFVFVFVWHKVPLSWKIVLIWNDKYGFKTTISQHSNLTSGSKVQLSDCSANGKEMIKLLNDYRQENGLPAIQKSCSLCTVANTKVDGTSWFVNSIAIDSHFKGCIYKWHWSFAWAQLDWSVCLRLWPSEESWLHVEEALPDYCIREGFQKTDTFWHLSF